MYSNCYACPWTRFVLKWSFSEKQDFELKKAWQSPDEALAPTHLPI